MTDSPELWWSPTDGLIEREDGMLWLLTKGPLLGNGEAPLPADAVRMMAVEDNDEHVIQLDPNGWTIKHPLPCRPNLFACPFNHAAVTIQGARLGRYTCWLDEDGALVIGEEIP